MVFNYGIIKNSIVTIFKYYNFKYNAEGAVTMMIVVGKLVRGTHYYIYIFLLVNKDLLSFSSLS